MGDPCFILPPYSEKKIFGKFCGIYYVCKNEIIWDQL